MSKGAVVGWGSGLGSDPATWPPVLTRVYRGSYAIATSAAAVDWAELGPRGYVVSAQAYVAGERTAEEFAIGCLLILLIGLGLLILAYLVIVKPPGALTVTYVRQPPPLPQSPAFQAFPTA